ncbi:MAG: tRNA (adenosine(37)-N6)-dimethylallyltransferase MiaA [Gammaproteobacteria bacterium]
MPVSMTGGRSPHPDWPAAVLLMGPTASGKTDLAVELVRRLPCDIISVDSAMVYREMDIGTAKPPPEVLEAAPHRLIDFLDPPEPYSAARFCADARAEMAAVAAAGRIPLLVGGTMMYFRALQQGLSALPSADHEVRRRLDAEARREGWPALHRRLAGIDPQAARRIHPNDPQRIQRALEVHELAGEPMTELLRRGAESALPYRLVKLALAPAARPELHRRIETRFRHMLRAGLVEEVERLRARGDLHPGLPSVRAVGYRQVWEYLAGNYPYEEMFERSVRATRQLAKRQMTWLRAEPDLTWFDAADGKILAEVLNFVRGSGL